MHNQKNKLKNYNTILTKYYIFGTIKKKDGLQVFITYKA